MQIFYVIAYRLPIFEFSCLGLLMNPSCIANKTLETRLTHLKCYRDI